MTNFFHRFRFIRLAAAGGIVMGLASCFAPLTKEDITADRLKADVSYLASDELAGRLVGSPGVAKAEEYIVSAFRADGLATAPATGGYFLEFPLYEYGFAREAIRLVTKEAGRVFDGFLEKDFSPLPFSGNGFAQGEIVFAGYGISAPEAGYDDYDGLDVRGKIVLVFRREPARFSTRRPSGEIEYSQRAFFTAKLALAAARGARAILFCDDPRSASRDGTTADELRLESRYSLKNDSAANDIFRDGGREKAPAVIPAFLLSSDWGERLLSAAGRKPAEIQEDLDRGSKPKTMPLPLITAVVSCARRSPPRTLRARDVAGFVAGGDPAVSDRWIVVAAHHDHIGSYPGDGDAIFNGADDNASGTSGVLELARAFSRRAPRLRHSLLFVTFSGEEEGLLGAEALFADRLLPADRFLYMCNLDMIGRNPDQPLTVIVRNQSSALSEAAGVFLAAQPYPAEISVKSDREAMSDDYEFATRGIPAFFFFAGLHPDYHGVKDEADRLDYQAMEKRVRLVYDFILYLDSLQ